MSRYNEINIQHFANLVKELKVHKHNQKEFISAVDHLYMAIFRHNTKGEYVIETMPNEEGEWKVYRPTQSKEEALLIIKVGKNGI